MNPAVAISQSRNDGSFLTMFLISFIAHFLSIVLFVLLPHILPHTPREAMGGPSGGTVNWVRLGPGTTPAKTSLKPTAQQEAAPSAKIEKLKKDDDIELKSKLTLPDPNTKKKDEPQPKATLNQPEKKLTGPFGTGKNVKTEGGTTGGQGKFGLGTAGAGGPGSGGYGTGTGVEFPFPWYIDRVIDKVEGTWVKPFISQPPSQALETVVYFVITKAGQVTDVKIEKESGIPALDRSAESAVLNSQPFPPLPPQWTEPDLAFRLTFQYTQ